MIKKKKVTARNEIERVQRLLALFDKTKGTPEGDRAREKADLLLHRHGWTEGEVRNTSRAILKGDALEWRQMLLALCAEHLGLEIKENDEKALTLEGLTAAIEDAERLFSRLDKRIHSASIEFAEDLSFHPSRIPLLEQGFATCAVMALADRLVVRKSTALIEAMAEEGPPDVETAAKMDGASDVDFSGRLAENLEAPLQRLTEDEDEFCTEGYLFGQQLPLHDSLRRSVAGLLPIQED